MVARQRIIRERRDYNRWVANQTLEDYALRFTAISARQWSAMRVANTALGSISFLALEAIGGSITVAYGFTNSIAAILAVSLLIFAISLPICISAARYGVDIDLLTRGAGFGYIGSTITSLIYASFTFIFFGIESVIVASMLDQFFGVPPWLGYILCAAAVLPLVTHGITFISRFQLWTQPVWLTLNLAALAASVICHPDWLSGWTAYQSGRAAGFDPLAFGACASVLLALVSQTAEQVDYLRFMPPRPVTQAGRRVWWLALLAGGPGWIVLDVVKLLAGSFLAYGALRLGRSAEAAVQPAQMYLIAFTDAVRSPALALVVTCAFVILSQLKINVTNAYAGSIAWSNFFSRLTHSHPGRVVWLVFNIAIALTLLELGAYETIQRLLVLYSNVAVAWIGALVSDLVVNKPLGLSPSGIEFKRAHLYDINPVGVGAMLLAVAVSFAAWWGVFGELASAMSSFIAFLAAFASAPLIAWTTGGKYYLARKPRAAWAEGGPRACAVCEHVFEPEDTAYCPAYMGVICSLCCSLDARCGDACKPHGRVGAQAGHVLAAMLPQVALQAAASPLGRFAGVFAVIAACVGLALLGIYARIAAFQAGASNAGAFWQGFFVLLLIGGVVAWLLVLAQESRRAAQAESRRQNGLLMSEIREHRRTDAALQRQLARFDAELADARRQQLSMMPDVFPKPDPVHPVAVHAVMIPAREVGGDLYDCFEAAPGVLCLAVGDVSDKGMPAALFMARTRSLLRGSALQHAAATGAPPRPSELASVLNEELCKNNDGSMFVTLFLGFLEVATGRLEFVNAGHVRPFRLRVEGDVEEVATPPGAPLGVRRGVRHADHALTLERCETLVMISDGIPEMTNPAGALYTLGRVVADLAALAGAPPETITAALAGKVLAFAAGIAASDDVTVMAVRRGIP